MQPTYTTTTTAGHTGHTGRGSHTLRQSVYALPAALLALAAWAVYVGGLASLQSDCDALGEVTRGLSNNPALPCSRAYRFHWFLMAWEFVIIMILVGAALSGQLFHMRAAIVGLFAVGTMLFIIISDQLLNGQSIAYYQNGYPLHRIRATTAGAIMVAIMDAIIIIVVGHYDEFAADRAAIAKDPAHTHVHNPV